MKRSDPRSASSGGRASPLVLALLAAPALAQDGVEARLERLEAENAELRERLDLLASELEKRELEGLVPAVGESIHGMGPAASKVYAREQGLSIGGYGELLYQNFAGDARTDRLDFLRGVLYTGYKFSERWVFNSELEVEHASTSESGEVSLEFAYLDYLHAEALNARVGLVLVPMGFINEMHEPTTYLEPTRPLTEQRILPSTWRENGAGVFGGAGDFSWRAYLINGLDASGFSASNGLRGGRQKGSEALADDFAFVGRLDWEHDSGLLLGTALYFGDSGQGNEELGDAGTFIYELHADWRWQGLWVRGLFAQAELDDVETLNEGLGLGGSSSIGERMQGMYVSLGYDLMRHLAPESRQSLSPFVRWETIDTQAAVPEGFDSDPANDVDVLSFGLNYRPIDQIVFKLGYEDWDAGIDRWNVQVGYVF